MNKLRHLVWRLGLNESEALNLLQDSFIISDHCLTLQSISSADAERATTFLSALYKVSDSDGFSQRGT